MPHPVLVSQAGKLAVERGWAINVGECPTAWSRGAGFPGPEGWESQEEPRGDCHEVGGSGVSIAPSSLLVMVWRWMCSHQVPGRDH